MALERIEGPFLGPRRDDLRAGVVASTVANVNRGSRKPMGAEDFILQFSDVSNVDRQGETLRALTDRKRPKKGKS